MADLTYLHSAMKQVSSSTLKHETNYCIVVIFGIPIASIQYNKRNSGYVSPSLFICNNRPFLKELLSVNFTKVQEFSLAYEPGGIALLEYS